MSGILNQTLAGKSFTQVVSSTDLLLSVPYDFVTAPASVVKTWNDALFPVVLVEKGWGTGVFQSLYAYNNYLWTAPGGDGVRADIWAGGQNLFVEIPYNQCAASPDPALHPVKLSDSKRVLLDFTVPNAPFFAGWGTGTQDPNQDPTIRGYSLPASFVFNIADYFTITMIMSMFGGENTYIVQDNVNGNTAYSIMDGANKRNYLTWNINTVFWTDGSNPIMLNQVIQNRGQLITDRSCVALQGGAAQASAAVSNATTTYGANIMGPVNPLKGKLYCLGIKKTDWTDSTKYQSNGIVTTLPVIATNAFTANKFEILYPLDNDVIAMDLATQTADIPIKVLGKPSTAYEASWNGGAYASIGTTNSAGYLQGSLIGQAKGNGTLSVREGATGTPKTVPNVAVGFVLYVMGESEPQGRGNNVTITVPNNFYRFDRINKFSANSTENMYWKLLVQKIYDTYTCVINATLEAQGSTFLVPMTTEAHWDPNSPRITVQNNYMLGFRSLARNNMSINPPNLFYWDIGKNDAAQNSTPAVFITVFQNILTGYRTENINTDFALILSGMNGTVPAIWTDNIRGAQYTLGTATSGFKFAGSFAHLPTTEPANVHFQTQAQKQAAIDVVWRHLYGSGLAPLYSSGSKSGADLTLNFTGGTSPLTIVGAATDLYGWAVTDANGARTVNSISVAGLSVTLTCDATLVSPVNVTFCSGNAGVVATVGTTLKDSAVDTPCPPYPFSATI